MDDSVKLERKQIWLLLGIWSLHSIVTGISYLIWPIVQGGHRPEGFFTFQDVLQKLAGIALVIMPFLFKGKLGWASIISQVKKRNAGMAIALASAAVLLPIMACFLLAAVKTTYVMPGQFARDESYGISLSSTLSTIAFAVVLPSIYYLVVSAASRMQDRLVFLLIPFLLGFLVTCSVTRIFGLSQLLVMLPFYVIVSGLAQLGRGSVSGVAAFLLFSTVSFFFTMPLDANLKGGCMLVVGAVIWILALLRQPSAVIEPATVN